MAVQNRILKGLALRIMILFISRESLLINALIIATMIKAAINTTTALMLENVIQPMLFLLLNAKKTTFKVGEIRATMVTVGPSKSIYALNLVTFRMTTVRNLKSR